MEKSKEEKRCGLKNFTDKPHILIVEDNKIVQANIKNMVLSFGCEVSVADTGHEAIEMYQKNHDLIFLDIYLPDMTGFGVYMAIRSQESIRHIPIIAITADENKKDECLAIGFDEFIVKPLSKQKCQEILIRWL